MRDAGRLLLGSILAPGPVIVGGGRIADITFGLGVHGIRLPAREAAIAFSMNEIPPALGGWAGGIVGVGDAARRLARYGQSTFTLVVRR